MRKEEKRRYRGRRKEEKRREGKMIKKGKKKVLKDALWTRHNGR